MTAPLVLGIETSCDETSAAVLRGEGERPANVFFRYSRCVPFLLHLVEECVMLVQRHGPFTPSEAFGADA